MLDLLRTIVDTISILIEFLISMIQSLIDLLIRIPSMLQFITRCFNFIPTIYIGFASLCLSIYVVLFLLGRNKS